MGDITIWQSDGKVWTSSKGEKVEKMFLETCNGSMYNVESIKVFHINENGWPHRKDGPAIEGHNGTKHWFQNGFLHREDGPAIEWADGQKSWYINGKKIE